MAVMGLILQAAHKARQAFTPSKLTNILSKLKVTHKTFNVFTVTHNERLQSM